MPLLVGALVLLASYGAGWAVTAGGRLGIADGLRRRATVFTAGFAFLELVALLFGSVHLFRPSALDPVALVFGALGAAVLARDIPAGRAAWARLGRERILLFLAAAIVLVDAVLSMAPPTSGDALAYHLVAPKLWLQGHQMFPLWWNYPTFQPFATEMHFAYAQALWSGASAIVVGAGLGGFSAVLVYGLARDLAGTKAAAVAALLWVGQGMFLWEATGGFVELVLSGFLVLAAWHAVAYLRSGRPLDLGWAGLAAGVAASTKIQGVALLPLFALVPLAAARAGSRVRALGLFAAGAAVGLPWLVRSWIQTGNPVYPLVFGGKYWNAASRADYAYSWQGYGIRGIWHLPFFPLEFVLQTKHYERGYSFSVALFVLAPLALVFSRRGWVRVVAVAVALYVVLWWQGMHQTTRYLLPALAFGAVLAGFAAVRLWERRWGKAILSGAAAVTAALLVVITGLYARQVLPGVVGTESTPAFVQRLTGDEDVFLWLEAHLPRRGRVLMMGFRNLYWFNRPYVRYTLPVFPSGNPPQVIRQRLREYDVTSIAYIGGTPPNWLMPELKQIATLSAVDVTSRTLGRVSSRPDYVRVYVWRRQSP